jgi:hypothetical protein
LGAVGGLAVTSHREGGGCGATGRGRWCSGAGGERGQRGCLASKREGGEAVVGGKPDNGIEEGGREGHAIDLWCD